MKIIFLDIDGVLNNHSTFGPGRSGDEAIEPGMVELVAGLVQETGARIVISSSWRSRGFLLMRELLARHGLDSQSVIGVTPYLLGGRGTEIREWMRLSRKPVKSFVILDDEAEDLYGLLEHLVQTDPYVGLTRHHIVRARKILLMGEEKELHS